VSVILLLIMEYAAIVGVRHRMPGSIKRVADSFELRDFDAGYVEGCEYRMPGVEYTGPPVESKVYNMNNPIKADYPEVQLSGYEGNLQNIISPESVFFNLCMDSNIPLFTIDINADHIACMLSEVESNEQVDLSDIVKNDEDFERVNGEREFAMSYNIVKSTKDIDAENIIIVTGEDHTESINQVLSAYFDEVEVF
jgi:hypothetical protein